MWLFVVVLYVVVAVVLQVAVKAETWARYLNQFSICKLYCHVDFKIL